MFTRLHSTRRLATAAVILLLLLAPDAGCALWPKDSWNLDRLRDQRSVDIERRLERTEPIVKNPF